MRWFKHLTHSHMDVGLCRLMDEFGPEGYGAYWLVLEAIAAQCETDNITLRLSVRNWRRILPFSPQKLANFMGFAGKSGLFQIETAGNEISVSCPKLLKYRDEYAVKREKKSGQTPDKIRVDIEQIQNREDKDRRIGQTASPAASFSGFTIFHQDGEMKISQRDFDAWQKAYPHIDLAAELQAMSDWTRSTKEWTKKTAFHACSAALKIKNEKARTCAVEKKRQEDSPPPPQRFN
jgi:hypothetical protein